MKDQYDKELPVCCVSGKIPYDCNCLMCKMWVISHCQECHSYDNGKVKKAYSPDENNKEGYFCRKHYEELVEV